MRCGVPRVPLSGHEKGSVRCFISSESGRSSPAWFSVMPERTYQVRVAGLAPDLGAQDDGGDPHLSARRIRTVLVARFGGQHALHDFLRDLRTYGLEVIGVRRLPAGEAVESRMVVGPTVSSTVAEHASYELTVSGDVDPELYGVLTPYAAALEELHTELCMQVPEDVQFLDLVLHLESRGAKIASIAVVDQASPRSKRAGIVASAVTLSPVDCTAV